MKQEINVYDFARAFKDMNRDYFSWEGYQALYDYYDEFPDFNLDVIAICCDVTEYDEEELKNEYSHVLGYEDFKQDNEDVYNTEEEIQEEYLKSLVEELNEETMVLELRNGNFIVWDYWGVL